MDGEGDPQGFELSKMEERERERKDLGRAGEENPLL
jgi:hypothetical protein